MPTNYPASNDTFSVTSLPEDTPLSQAGPGATRNHPQMEQDQGDAIEALQVHAAQKTHDHSGDDEDPVKGPKLTEINTHEASDVDSSGGAKHHTLGTSAYQAAAGNHNHDYNNLANIPFKICTSSTRPGAPVTGMVIYETDTKRWRQWDLFANNVIVAGVDSTINFNAVNSTGPGTGWEVWNEAGDSDHGIAATPDGSHLSWIDEGDDANRVILRRTEAADDVTDTDDQVITWKTGDQVIEYPSILTWGSASNDKYFRMSADRQAYIRLEVGTDFFRVSYTVSGPANEKELGRVGNINTKLTNTEWRAELKERTLTLYRTGELVGAVKDTKFLTAKGVNHRGWAVGMAAGDRVIPWANQTSPANIDWVRIQDVRTYSSINRWTLLPLGAIPNVRLRQSTAQKLTNTGTILQWTEELEDNFGYFNPASPTEVVIGEAGLYDVLATLQWDDQFVPDVAQVVVMINGAETTVKDSRYIRGNGFVPGFSQTISVSGPLRLAEGDRITVKASYRASNNLLDLIFSYFDAPSRVNSRFELRYVAP